MSEETPVSVAPPAAKSVFRPLIILCKIIVSVVIFAHLSILILHVSAAGGPFVLRQGASWIRPYLDFIWQLNAYRYYAPNPGDTEVIWYKLIYEDGNSSWYVLPDRDQFYLRMPFQRHMSLALLASMKTATVAVSMENDVTAVASLLTMSRPATKQVVTAEGSIYFRSFARHIARKFPTHYRSKAKLSHMECYYCKYRIRLPDHMRENIAMFDPRMVSIEYVSNLDTTGAMSNYEAGFREKVQDDFFIEQVQNDLLPLIEANSKLPEAERQPIMKLLKEYGIPYPLIQPLDKLTEAERIAFFQKPVDRDTLRERYATIVKRDDKQQRKLEVLKELEQRPPTAAEKTVQGGP